MLRRALLLLLALVATSTTTATAHAAVTPKKAIWGPVEIDSQSQFPVYKELGAGIYQATLDWSTIASLEPLKATDVDDPSYEWPDEIDTAISEAKSSGIRVALTVTGAPEWANGSKPATTGPTKASDYATFIAVAAKRYPTVHLWTIWDGPYKGGAKQYAPLLDGAYAKLKSVSKSNKVIGGQSTATTAAKWIPKLKLPNGKAPRMDFYGHNPSATKAPTAATLKTLEAKVAKLGKGLKLYLSPVKLTLSPTKQAAWIKTALKATKADKNVYTFGYQGLIGDSGVPSTYNGLLNVDGEKTAAFTAFKNG
jgi:hypothetical protein